MQGICRRRIGFKTFSFFENLGNLEIPGEIVFHDLTSPINLEPGVGVRAGNGKCQN